MEPAPGGPCRRGGHGAGDRRQPRDGAGRAAASRRAGRGCRDGTGARRVRASRASSTMRPAYITATRSARPATMPRSWVISSTAIPRAARRRSSTSRIWAWTVTSSAVVGSSAMSRSGSDGEGDGDHHALAHAAAQLVRILVEAGDRDRGCRPPAAAPARAARASARDIRWWARTLSMIWSATVKTGLRLVIGSWKIIPIRRPRTLRSARSVQREEIGAVEPDDAAGGDDARRGHQPEQGERGEALAAARLADQREQSRPSPR